MTNLVDDESVVLLDEARREIGTAPKVSVHGPKTPLHLAFSVYLFDADDRVLMTRRALEKKTWPGVWTNSCCGHPRPGQPMLDAVRNRVDLELGVDVKDLRLVLPDFAYRAVDASGIVENEFCPVYVGVMGGRPLAPNPVEVAESAWVAWTDLVSAVSAVPFAFSPWMVAQLALLPPLLAGAPS